MKNRFLFYSRFGFILTFFLSILGFPSIAISNGQGDSNTSGVEKFIEKIETKYDISITIDSKAVKQDKKLISKIDTDSKKILKSKNAEEALSQLTEGTDFQFKKLRDDYYVIKEKEVKEKPVPVKLKGQEGGEKIIKGTVTSKSDGLTLPGVNVFVKGTTIGVATDIDGKYEISVPEDAATLVFSFMGYKQIEVPINGRETIDVAMEDDIFGLEEVVVSGVASATPRRNLTVSVTKIDAKAIEQVPPSSAAEALQGKVAGVEIVHANGLPGSGAAIRIRGSSSLTGNQKPMVVLDGTIMYTNLADINTDDIESYEVVKGAAASALYGSQAGNGVIVIHTKRGKVTGEEKTSVIFRQEVGFQKLAKQIELATHHPYKLADDWEDFPYTKYAGIWYNDDGYPISGNRVLNDPESSYADQPYAQIYNNQDLFFTKGMYSTSYISFSGASKKSSFMVSYEHNRQQGILFETEGYKRNNLRLNLDHNISKKIKVSTSNLFLTTNSDNPGSNATFNDLLFMGPDVDLKQPNADGTPYLVEPDPWSIAQNPLYPLAYRERTSKRMSFIGNVQAIWDIYTGLTANIKYAYEYRNKQWNTYTPKGYLYDAPTYIKGSLFKESYYEFNQNFQTTLNYIKQINDFTGKLKLSYLYENQSFNDFWVTGREFSVADVPQLDWTDPTKASMSSNEGKKVAINYIGILDLDYQNKYLFSVLYRMDGSSLFGANERWHPFYRVSGAYRITQEIDIPGIQELKVRAAYGTSGQRPKFSWQYETWSGLGGYIVPGTMGNKNLKPSVTKELEVGLNLDFLNRFSFEFVYSNSNTEGAIQNSPIPSHIGYSNQWANVGDINAQVFEATLSTSVIKNQTINWNINLMFDRVRQKITKLVIPPYNTGPRNAFYFREGETFATMYGYKWVKSLDEMANQLPAGKTIDDYQLNSDGYVIEKGTEGTNSEIPIALDVDNDGLADKVQIGNGNPNFNLSLSNTFDVKGFTVYFLLAWKNGGDVYNYTRQYTFRDLRAIEFDQNGKPENEKKSISYYSTFYKNTEVNSYFVEDASFLKLRELSLYYTFNNDQLAWFAKDLIKSIRVGVQARNVFTITNYTGYDPEVSSGSDLTNYYFDDFGYPNFRTFSGSIQLTF